MILSNPILGVGYSAGVVGLWAANVFGSRFNTTETISFFWVLGSLVMLVRRLQPSATQAAGMLNTKAGAPRV